MFLLFSDCFSSTKESGSQTPGLSAQDLINVQLKTERSNTGMKKFVSTLNSVSYHQVVEKNRSLEDHSMT